MPRDTRSLPQTTRCFVCSVSAGLLAEGSKLLGHEWVFSRRRDARLEGSLEISRRFSPNVFKWYGATFMIAAFLNLIVIVPDCCRAATVHKPDRCHRAPTL